VEFANCALGLLANLKETRQVQRACWVEVTSITSSVKGVMVVIPKWKLEIMQLKVGSKNEGPQGVLLNHDLVP
jgi:hypothetical protein